MIGGCDPRRACCPESEKASVEATRTFLRGRSTLQPVATGVRYPVISPVTAGGVDRYSRRLDDSAWAALSTVTYFGRHRAPLSAFQNWVRRDNPTGPFQALVVGAGFGPTMEKKRLVERTLPPESSTVLEWLGVLGQTRLNFYLDVVDPSPEIADYFARLSQAEEYTFFAFDGPRQNSRFDAIPSDFPPQVFGRYATEVTGSYSGSLPEGAEHVWRVTFPRELLQRVRFVRGNVLGPLPSASYNLMDFHNVAMYLPGDRWLRSRNGSYQISLDMANLVLNLELGGWMMTGEISLESVLRHELISMPFANQDGYAYRVYGFRDPLLFMERQSDGSWQPGLSSDDNDDGRSLRVSYRGSRNETTRREDGGELLGLYSGETVPSVPSDLVRTKGTGYLLEGAEGIETRGLPRRLP